MRSTIDKSGSFVASQFGRALETQIKGRSDAGGPAVTISHETGAGAHEVGERVRDLLDASERSVVQHWTVLDRQLVERTLEEHHLPLQLAKKMPEDKRSYLDDVLDDLFGLRPPSWVLIPQMVETIVHLAQTGHVVLIGRGATVVTSQLPNVFHVRLVASLKTRIRRVQKSQELSAEEASRFVEKEDRGRQRYVRANFQAHLGDALLYHMVLNTDLMSFDDAASLIAEGARRHFQRS